MATDEIRGILRASVMRRLCNLVRLFEDQMDESQVWSVQHLPCGPIFARAIRPRNDVRNGLYPTVRIKHQCYT